MHSLGPPDLVQHRGSELGDAAAPQFLQRRDQQICGTSKLSLLSNVDRRSVAAFRDRDDLGRKRVVNDLTSRSGRPGSSERRRRKCTTLPASRSGRPSETSDPSCGPTRRHAVHPGRRQRGAEVLADERRLIGGAHVHARVRRRGLRLVLHGQAVNRHAFGLIFLDELDEGTGRRSPNVSGRRVPPSVMVRDVFIHAGALHGDPIT